MRNRFIIAAVSVMSAVILSACSGTADKPLKPTLGIEWFTSYEDVKGKMDSYTLLSERENKKQRVPQKMQDYSGVELFEQPCDLTMCFTDSGLIDFNYHDTDKNKNYKSWYSTLEEKYGLPTEEGSGMASWYDDPAGNDTVIYLFNLQEGVQVSVYATSDSPDKTYGKKNGDIPTPELRTPVVPPEENRSAATTTAKTSTVSTTATTGPYADIGNVIGTDDIGNYIVVVTDPVGEAVTDIVGETVTTLVPITTTAATTVSTVTGSTTSAVTTESGVPAENNSRSFLVNGLKFYGDPDSERRKMIGCTKGYEYRTEDKGQPWELIMEYENVPYLGRNCGSVLCFTSLGLVGVNYFDSSTTDYSYWVKALTDIYGKPDEEQDEYAAWKNSPVGKDTMIYVFALDDGIQISFFADDTGSELA